METMMVPVSMCNGESRQIIDASQFISMSWAMREMWTIRVERWKMILQMMLMIMMMEIRMVELCSGEGTEWVEECNQRKYLIDRLKDMN